MPPQALSTIIIDAPPQQVWDVLIDFDHWPDWNTWFTTIKAHELPTKLGTRVTFTNRMSDTAKPGTYTTRITTWNPERTEFGWKGGPMWEAFGWVLRGHHWFRLVEQEGGNKTMFDHGEEVEGLLSVLVPSGMVRDLVGMLDKFNGELKKRVEQGVKKV